jgi:hypothetical protein
LPPHYPCRVWLRLVASQLHSPQEHSSRHLLV